LSPGRGHKGETLSTASVTPLEPSETSVLSPGAAVAGTATATAVILACGVVTGLIAARSLGPAGRGELAAIITWASVLLFAGAFGLPEAVAYFAAADRESRDRVWTTGQAGAVALGLLVAVIGWWAIPVAFGVESAALAGAIRWYLILFAVPCLGFACAASWLQGAGSLHAFNVSRSSLHVISAVLMLALALAGSQSVMYFAGATLIGTAAGWLLSTVLAPVRQLRRAPPSIALAKRMLHYGVRVQVGNWSNAASLRLDQLLLSLFAMPATLGVYVVAVSYANMLLTIPASAAMVMLPEMVERHAAGAARACLERWYRRLLWATVLGAIAIGLLGAIIVPFAFGSAFRDAVPLLVVLMPAALMLGMNDILSTAFLGIGRPDITSKGEVVGLVVTVAALSTLLPRYGVLGAALASLLAYGSIHVYLTRQAVVIIGTDLKSLCVPTHDDLAALRQASVRAQQWLARAASKRAVRTHEL
jgi:O-antigen/teichoic acid export membrane protein